MNLKKMTAQISIFLKDGIMNPSKYKKNINEIFDNLHFDVYHPEIVPCKFRNDANLIGALYQHIQTFK